MKSCSVVVVNPTFDYGKHLRSIGRISSQLCAISLSSNESESSLSSSESQTSVSTVETLTQSCTSLASIQSQTTTQSEAPSTSTMTQSHSQTPHTQTESKSRSTISLHRILPPPNTPSSSTPFIHAPVCSSTTLYGELVNSVSAIGMAAQFVAGGLRCVCIKAKRKLSWSRTLKYACGMYLCFVCVQFVQCGMYVYTYMFLSTYVINNAVAFSSIDLLLCERVCMSHLKIIICILVVFFCCEYYCCSSLFVSECYNLR